MKKRTITPHAPQPVDRVSTGQLPNDLGLHGNIFSAANLSVLPSTVEFVPVSMGCRNMFGMPVPCNKGF